jgi:hypothetical protein
MKCLPISSANTCGQLNYGVPVIYNARQYVTRLDWIINANHSIYGRYLQDNYDQPAPWTPATFFTQPRLGLVRSPRPSCWANLPRSPRGQAKCKIFAHRSSPMDRGFCGLVNSGFDQRARNDKVENLTRVPTDRRRHSRPDCRGYVLRGEDAERRPVRDLPGNWQSGGR